MSALAVTPPQLPHERATGRLGVRARIGCGNLGASTEHRTRRTARGGRGTSLDHLSSFEPRISTRLQTAVEARTHVGQGQWPEGRGGGGSEE